MKLKRPCRSFAACTALILTVPLMAQAESEGGCFTIVVGKEASADGFVIMAHNENDGPPQVVNHRRIAGQEHPDGEKVSLRNGGELDQVSQTWALLWSEMPGMLFSDSYVNEWGVCVTSDNCPSREDQPELTDGGISYMMRRLVAERAKTSRQGVLLLGELVETFGYTASGRSYIISDPNEGWVVCVVNGKHWVAQKVSDDMVAVVSNTYTIHQVNLEDHERFLASPDLIEYAVGRGWYHPELDGEFDFAAVYADSGAAAHPTNIGRQWSGLRLLGADAVEFAQGLPFEVEPEDKLDVAAVTQILRDHYEGTEHYESLSPTGCPHDRSFKPICRRDGQTSFVVQLRADMPLDIGIVYWVCLASPCGSCFVPFHFGVARFPEGYCTGEGQQSESHHQAMVEGPFVADPLKAFWTFSNFRQKVEGTYSDRIVAIRAEMHRIESRALTMQTPLEETALRLYSTDSAATVELLEDYSHGLFLASLEAMERLLSEE
jgi:dipeptidase